MSGANRESADVGGYLGHCLGKWYKIKRIKTACSCNYILLYMNITRRYILSTGILSVERNKGEKK